MGDSSVLGLIERGEYVFVKCEDDSEAFLCKKGNLYRISKDRLFRHSTQDYTYKRPVIDFLSTIRGYGTYVPDGIDGCNSTYEHMACGCDS